MDNCGWDGNGHLLILYSNKNLSDWAQKTASKNNLL